MTNRSLTRDEVQRQNVLDRRLQARAARHRGLVANRGELVVRLAHARRRLANGDGTEGVRIRNLEASIHDLDVQIAGAEAKIAALAPQAATAGYLDDALGESREVRSHHSDGTTTTETVKARGKR